jgi:MFS family permease
MPDLLRHRDFRVLFTGLVASMIAESILILALAIWVKDLTGSDGLAGATFVAMTVPMVLAPLLGWVVDRVPRKPLFVLLNVLTAALLTPLLAVREAADVWIVYAVGALYGLSYVALGATVTALVQELVPADLLPAANGAVQTVKQGLRLVGPLIGAGLYTVLGGATLAAVCAAGFLAAAGVGALLRARPQPVTAPDRPHWAAEVAAGARHLVGEPALRRVLVGAVLIMVALGVGESLYFAYVDRGLGREPAFLGVLVSAQGVGGLLGGLGSAAVVRRVGELAAVALGAALFAAGSLSLTYPTLWLAVPASALIGLGLPITMVGAITLLQRRTPAHLLGRASAALDALVSGPQALAIGLGAVLVGLVDYRLLFGLIALTSAGVAGYLWLGRGLSAPTGVVAAEPTAPEVSLRGSPAAP